MKFLLITEARSGTHMLRGAFMAHPDIAAFADYRNDLVTVGGGLVAFLNDLYSEAPADSTVGAFTHFGELRRQSKTEESGWVKEDWQSLRAIHDHIVVLTRRCGLRRFLSLELSIQKGDSGWSCDTSRGHDPPPIKFDLDKFLAWYRLTTQNRKSISALMEPYHLVVYEDLVRDWEGVMHGVYDHLGLRWDDPKIATFQQEHRPLESIVEDWDLVLRDAAARGVNLLDMA